MKFVKKSITALLIAGIIAGCTASTDKPADKEIGTSFDSVVEKMENGYEFDKKIEKDNATYYIYDRDNGKTYALKIGTEPYETFDDYDIYVGDWMECSISGDEIKSEILEEQYFVTIDKKGNVIEWSDSLEHIDACDVDSKC